MTIDELKKKISSSLGVSSSETELAFTIFVKKLAEQLAPGLTIKVPGVGFFQLKKNDAEDKTDEILFSPLRESLSDKVTFVSIETPLNFYEEPSEDTETFSIGVGKPVIPIGEEAEQDAEASFVVFKKLIEERTNDLLSESERIPDTNIWDEYYKSEKSEPKSDLKTELSELTADLHFDEDQVSEDIVNNIIDDRDADANAEDTEEEGDLTPSKLLEDYETFETTESTDRKENADENEDEFGLEYLLENLDAEAAEGNPDNEVIPEAKDTGELEIKDEEAPEEIVEKVDGEVDLSETVDETPEEHNEEAETDEEETQNMLEDVDEDNKGKDETAEIEIELGKHRKKDLEDFAERIEVEDTHETVDVDVEDEDEFLGLRKKIQENTEWNWGDELKEELENYDDTEFEEEMEDVRDEDILKSPRPVSENLFEKLETTIKEELKEERISTKYEFVEQKEERRPVTSAQQNTYEDEQEFKEEKTGYLKYVIIGLFVAIMFAGVIYLFFNGGEKTEPEINAGRQNASVEQEHNNSEIASLAEEQNENLNENIPPVIEDDFPRVAKLEDKTNKQAAPAPRQSVDNAGLYINPANDIHVYKTIFTDGSRYYVQASSWRNETKAINEVSNWKRKGYNAYIMKVNIPEKGGLWFRVRVGPFGSESEARKFYEQNF